MEAAGDTCKIDRVHLETLMERDEVLHYPLTTHRTGDSSLQLRKRGL